jgi:glycosyltransferase involved in cell wall biosynthesis
LKVSILLSTYNSGAYLQAQLDSLLNQSINDITIYVRDDGSKDNSVSLIKDYANRHSQIVWLAEEKANIRPAQSFIRLMTLVDADYYLFCDHDDVWFEEKVAISLDAAKALESTYEGKAVLVATDLVVVDEKLSVISDSFAKYSGIRPDLLTGFTALAATNYVTGCTVLFNRKLRDEALKRASGHVEMHDHWLALVALACGGQVRYLPVPTVYYRQHDGNVIGAKPKRFPGSLLTLPESWRVLMGYYQQAKAINPSLSKFALIRAKISYRVKYVLCKYL